MPGLADPPPVRRTLEGAGSGAVEVRRSKFWGYARPLGDDPEELRRWLGEIRARHRDARHVVYAWRDAGGRSRGSDDGEPHGTGARPCLDALGQVGVGDAAVAVARIFGGVLLGAGNLGRAYADAAVAAIAAAGVRDLHASRRFCLSAGFADAAPAERALRGLGALELVRTADADGVQLKGWLPTDGAARLAADLAAATSGRARLHLDDQTEWR